LTDRSGCVALRVWLRNPAPGVTSLPTAGYDEGVVCLHTLKAIHILAENLTLQKR